MAALLAAVVLVACRKDASNSPVPVDAGMASVNVTSLVRSFVDHARGAAAPKAGATLSADSAEWYVEAALNYSLAKAWLEYNDVVADSAVVSVPLNDGEVSVTATYEAFNTLHALLATVEEEGVQHLAIVDVAAKEAGAELRLEVRYLVGSGYEKGVNASYGPNDAWSYWTLGPSNCNCLSNTTPSNICADKRIQQRVQDAIRVPVGPYEYWTNIETWFLYDFEDIDSKIVWNQSYPNPDNTSGKSNQDFLTYRCSQGVNCSTCLESDDMSHHTQGTYDVLQAVRSSYCPTKTPMTVEITGDLGPGTLFFHSAVFTYGIKQSGSGS